MPKNRPNYSVLLKRNEDNIRKIFESEFWRCEYTKRKYILDSKTKPNIEMYDFLNPYGVDLIDYAARFVMYHADVVLGIVGDESAPRNEMYEYLEQVIIAYHNFEYGENPKYRIEDNTGSGFEFLELADCVGDREIRSIKILHADARKYGFFPIDLITIHPIEDAERVINTHKDEYGMFPDVQSSFLRDEKQDPDFNFKDKSGKRFFTDENFDDAVYVYVNCLDENETIEKIYNRINGLVNKALKNNKAHRAGDRDRSDIQICFYNKYILHDREALKKIIQYSVAAYRNWYYPEKFMLTDDTIKVSKYLMVPEYENVPFHKRAAGLWIWDQVHFHKSKLSVAIEKSRTIESLKIYDCVEYSSVLRLYNLAKKSVEKMKVLKFSDLNK